MNLLLSEGVCRFIRSRKHKSCELYVSQKEKSLCFIQEKVQSCARLLVFRARFRLVGMPTHAIGMPNRCSLCWHAKGG